MNFLVFFLLFSICNRKWPSGIKDKFTRVLSKFSQRGQFMKTLKTQVKFYPCYYEDLLRFPSYNTEIKIFGKLSMHTAKTISLPSE